VFGEFGDSGECSRRIDKFTTRYGSRGFSIHLESDVELMVLISEMYSEFSNQNLETWRRRSLMETKNIKHVIPKYHYCCQYHL